MSFEEIIELAELGDTDAMVMAIQEFVWNEHIEIKQTPTICEKVVEYLNKAIMMGNAQAMNQLGAMYAEGRMVERDPEQAFLFYKMASEKGDAVATSNLGFCFLYGNGTEKNAEEAYKAFSKAAFLGMSEAYVRLGDMFKYGTYVTQDPCTALTLYKKAYKEAKRNLNDWGMQQVYSDVCKRIGDLYFDGIAVERNVAESIKWYSDALKYYMIREEKGDSYSLNGLEKTKEKLKQAMNEIL